MTIIPAYVLGTGLHAKAATKTAPTILHNPNSMLSPAPEVGEGEAVAAVPVLEPEPIELSLPLEFLFEPV